MAKWSWVVQELPNIDLIYSKMVCKWTLGTQPWLTLKITCTSWYVNPWFEWLSRGYLPIFPTETSSCICNYYFPNVCIFKILLFIYSFTYLCVCADMHVSGLTCEWVCAGLHMPQITCGQRKTTLGSWYSPATWWDLGIELRSSGLCASTSAHWTIPPQDLLREIFAGVWRWRVPGSLIICILDFICKKHTGVSQLRALHKELPHHEEGIFPQLENRASLSPLTPIRKEAISQGGDPMKELAAQFNLAMLSLADQGNVYSPRANISTTFSIETKYFEVNKKYFV